MRQFPGEMKPTAWSSGLPSSTSPTIILKLEAHEQAYFGGNRDKSREIKQHWDPDNFFNWPQGIRLPRRKMTQKAVVRPS